MAASNINTVADYFIATAHDCGDLITNLKLQKLAYYAQAWHLAIHDLPLVDDEFEAWVHGPVAPSLYDRFKKHRWNPISDDIVMPDLPRELREHLDEVQEAYGAYGAYELERMTHAEEPWLAARSGLSADTPSNKKISRTLMRDFYRLRMDDDETD